MDGSYKVLLSEDSKCDANIRGQLEQVPLHYASGNGHLDVVKHLMETCHCDPLCQDMNMVTPLHCTSSSGHLKIVKYFTVDCCCDPLIKTLY